MRKKKANDIRGGFLLLLLFVLATHALRSVLAMSVPPRTLWDQKIYVQISGEIERPGVYGFSQPPHLSELVARAGGFSSKGLEAFPFADVSYNSGAKVDVHSEGQKARIMESEMPGFYKMTLGIPISINKESLEGLAALPGIGPNIACSIIRERLRRGSFQKVDEILSVKGIGPRLYTKISPYLAL